MVSGYGKTTHYYSVRLCTKFGVLGTGAGDRTALVKPPIGLVIAFANY
jgi:hypothetical protein